MPTAKNSISWTNGLRTVSGTQEYTGDAATTVDPITIADSETDTLVSATIDISQVKHIFMLSTVDMTIETNSSSAPTDTWVLQANVPYVWNVDLGVYYTNKITADVTAIYLTNASGAAGTFQMEVLYDSTP